MSAAGIDVDESDLPIHMDPARLGATAGRALRARFQCPASIGLSAGDFSARLTATAQWMSKRRIRPQLRSQTISVG
jgi:hypothetical protein